MRTRRAEPLVRHMLNLNHAPKLPDLSRRLKPRIVLWFGWAYSFYALYI